MPELTFHFGKQRSASTPRTGRRPLRLGLFGCPLGTGNRGVSALGLATAEALAAINPDVELTLFDFGPGTRRRLLRTRQGEIVIQLVECFPSRRYYRTSNLAQAHWAARLGLGSVHPLLRLLTRLDGILDISGGDSFSDIYGLRRFAGVSLPKRLSLELSLPLVLLPQTYGPYRHPEVLRTANDILRDATQVWARDPISFQTARSMLAETFDPARHRCGVDVAFGLPAAVPSDPRLLVALRRMRKQGDLLIGLNVSGLLHYSPGESARRYGMLDPYPELMRHLLDRLLDRPEARVLLVPHVTTRNGDLLECDAAAGRRLCQSLTPQRRRRVYHVPAALSATEIKWVIGQCDWFCGTRMHACIAALSQGIATASVAYSDKTLGVFQTLGAGEAVADPRRLRCGELVEHLLSHLDRRESMAAHLAEQLPQVRRTLAEQFQAIYEALQPKPARSAGEATPFRSANGAA